MCPSLLVVCALGLAAAGAEEATEPQPNVYGYKDNEITQGLGYGHHLHPFYYRGASKRYYNCAIEDEWKPFASEKPKPQKTSSPPKKFSYLAEMSKGKPKRSQGLHKLIPKLFNEIRKSNIRMQRRGDSGYELKEHLEEEHARLVQDINSMTDLLGKNSRYALTRLLPVGQPGHASAYQVHADQHQSNVDQQPSAYNLHFDRHPPPYNLPVGQHTLTYELPVDKNPSTYNLPMAQHSSAYNLQIDKPRSAYNLPVNQHPSTYNQPVEQHSSAYRLALDQHVSDYNLPIDQHVSDYNLPGNPEVLDYNLPVDQHVSDYNLPEDPTSSYQVREEVESPPVIKMFVFKQQPFSKSLEQASSTAKPYNSLAVEVNGQMAEPFRLVPLVPLVPVPARAVYRPVPYKGYNPVTYKLVKQEPPKPSLFEKVLRYFPKIL